MITDKLLDKLHAHILNLGYDLREMTYQSMHKYYACNRMIVKLQDANSYSTLYLVRDWNSNMNNTIKINYKQELSDIKFFQESISNNFKKIDEEQYNHLSNLFNETESARKSVIKRFKKLYKNTATNVYKISDLNVGDEFYCVMRDEKLLIQRIKNSAKGLISKNYVLSFKNGKYAEEELSTSHDTVSSTITTEQYDNLSQLMREYNEKYGMLNEALREFD